MRRLRNAHRAAATASLALVVAAVSGCTSQPVERRTQSPSPFNTPATSQAPLAHPSSGDKNRTELAFLDEQTGDKTVGIFEREGPILYVDLVCTGGDFVRINIDGVGSFPVPCGDDGAQLSQNEFEVSFVDTFTVDIEASEDQRWAVSLFR